LLVTRSVEDILRQHEDVEALNEEFGSSFRSQSPGDPESGPPAFNQLCETFRTSSALFRFVGSAPRRLALHRAALSEHRTSAALGYLQLTLNVLDALTPARRA
jgi:hypothetical protein